MQTILILTDIHLRSDYVVGYLDKQIETLTKLVNNKKPNAVVINGDIFHKRNPRGPELLAFKQLLTGLKTKQIIINRGNHDTISKSDATATVLSLFADERIKIVEHTEVVHICGVDLLFVPHYEDEKRILDGIKSHKDIPIFGHWGFQGCVASRGRQYESLINLHHLDDRYVFLGHLHTPQVFKDKVFICGTQYSVSFGESNQDKYLHEIIIHDRQIHSISRKLINFGIRHITGTIAQLDDLMTKFPTSQYFVLARMELDKLDSSFESKIYQDFMTKHSPNHFEFSIKPILMAPQGNTTMTQTLFGQNIEELIQKYVGSSQSVFSQEELMQFYDKEIKNI